MPRTKRIASLAAAIALAGGGIAAPALGAASKWSPKQCRSYKTSFLHRRHNHPTAAQLAAANRVLARHGCTIKA